MTRIEAVRFAIQELEKKRRVVTKGRMGLIPLDGMEEQFNRINDAILSLKEICQAIQAEGVKRSIAVWQDEIKEEPQVHQGDLFDMIREQVDAANAEARA